MKTDISKLPLTELKHSLGVFLQMGRVQLDSDWNEQTEISLRRLQRQTEDVAGDGSPNNGFRVDERILLDAMDSREGWVAEKDLLADPDPTFYVDYFDFKTGEGSLVVQGAARFARKLKSARDLSQWKEIVFAAKGSFGAGEVAFFLGEAGTRGALLTVEDPAPIDGWRIFRADPSSALGVALANIDELGFTALNKAKKYEFDYIKYDGPLRQTLVKTVSTVPFTATTANPGDVPQLKINDTDRYRHRLVLEVTNVTTIGYELPAVRDLSHVRRLIVAARTGSGAAPAINFTVTDAANANVVLAGAPVGPDAGSWYVWSFALPQAGVNWTQVKSVRWGGLTPATVYRFAEVLVESELQSDLVIMGGDGSSKGAGRFYGDGLAAVKESHETYFSQEDLPEANPLPMAAPAAGMKRIDLAYLDLWERPITYIEDADIREIALEGPDTCTRTRLIAQVRLIKGAEVAVAGAAQPPYPEFDNLPVFGKGVLTTKDKADAVVDACADPCEPAISGTFLGEENRLFRVEIHSCGAIGAAGAIGTATFKWSRENGAAATSILDNADAGAFTVKVEKPELFAVGELIEISNDLVDLVTGPYEDSANHRCNLRGELRKISSINVATRLISWQDAGSPEPQFHLALPRPQRLVHHPSVRRWNGLLPVTPGDIVLADGVVIEFGGSDMIPGDYWVFTTRVIDRSVERLVEQPPHGILHRYFPLAEIARSKPAAQQIVTVRDLRPHFDALTRLKATDIFFDPGACAQEDPAWAGVENVQQAINALCHMDVEGGIEDHNKHLHGSGIVCGFQVHCNADRELVTVEKGYALDCEGRVIRATSPFSYDVIAQANQIGALDGAGNGEVWLSMTRGSMQEAMLHVEQAVPLNFWHGVLEGTLLMDFYKECIENLFNFFKAGFTPISSTTVPVSEQQKRLVSVINLLWQLVQASTGQYVFLSPQEADDPNPFPREHEFLHKLYNDIKALIASHTFCAQFDNLTAFPEYPYKAPLPGIDTVFGLFNFHHRMRLHPNGKLAYTCGHGNRISVFNMETGLMIASLAFPGGANVKVKDVAVAPDGNTLYAVGVINGEDSVFARAVINQATNEHTWGPTSVVCNILFSTLGTSSAHPNNLYAIGLSRGLFILDPLNIPPAPVANVSFNATGLMEISTSPDVAVVGESNFPVGTVKPDFDHCRLINLASPALSSTFACSGVDDENDIAFVDNMVYITAELGPGKGLFKFNTAGVLVTPGVALNTDFMVRIAPTPDKHWMLVTAGEDHKIERVNISPSTPLLDSSFRIPVQIIPSDIVVNAAAGEAYVVNLLSCTLSTIDLAAVFAGSAPAYTAEPPVTLAAYRNQMLQAFHDLLNLFWQYLKDCFCEHFLVDCVECSKDDRVYLGGIEIKDFKVYKICNFTKRRYVKSEQLVEYWLSTIPIIPIIKKFFADFCCKVI